jgi:hypothetical protein
MRFCQNEPNGKNEGTSMKALPPTFSEDRAAGQPQDRRRSARDADPRKLAETRLTERS